MIMSDKEILKKLFKIAQNQQKIINKLAQAGEPISDQEKDQFEEIFVPVTTAWLTKNLTENGLLENNNVNRAYAASGSSSTRSAVLTPTVVLLNADKNQAFKAKLEDPNTGLAASLRAALNSASNKPALPLTVQDLRVYTK
jgi:hypothetical protein